MKKIVCTVLSALLVMTSFIGCTDKEDKEVKEAKGVFYKIEKEGKILYLGGSVHVSPKGAEYKFSEEVNKAFEESDVLALELDFNNIKAEEAIPDNAVYSSDDNLSNHISDDSKSYLNDILKEINVSYNDISKYELWYIPQLISSLQFNKLGYVGTEGIDYTFLKKANGVKKEVVGIETIKEQVDVLKILSEPSEDELNKKVLEIPNLKATEESINKIVDSVYDGDEKELENIEKASQEGFSEKFYDELVTKRDTKMFEAIENYINEEKTYFVCVGALHVVGEKGIVYKLENAGYTVTRM